MNISVIIPALNEAKNIEKTVSHLAKTGGSDCVEIIVVDGKSVDETVVLAEKAGARVLISEKTGRAAQMNLGAKMAVGEVVYFVHADTLPPETWAVDVLKVLEKGGEMGCFRYRFDSKSWLLVVNAWTTRLPFLWCQGGDKTFFIRKTTFFELGGYDENQLLMEEYAFLKRVAKIQKRVVIVPNYVLVSARKYEHNSWLRVNLANLVVFNLFRFGVDSAVLKRLYSKLLRS